MRNGTFYLNNSGSRWVVLKDGKHDMPFYLLLDDGTYKLRQADYYTMWGNHGCIAFRYKGLRIKQKGQNTHIDLDSPGVRYEKIPSEQYNGLPVIKECDL